MRRSSETINASMPQPLYCLLFYRCGRKTQRWRNSLTVALGSYAALGFLVAAKQLIRIKEFENRDFAEYFLIGTLESILAAPVLGLSVRTVSLEWWV